MKKCLVVLFAMVVVSVCYADTYVIIDKEDNTIKGVSSISDKHLSDWKKQFDVRKVDDSFNGKQPYEIKYSNGNVRLANKQEIDSYLESKKQEEEGKKLQEDVAWLLKLLDDKDVKVKIRGL